MKETNYLPGKISSSFLCHHRFHCIELSPLMEYFLCKRATRSTKATTFTRSTKIQSMKERLIINEANKV